MLITMGTTIYTSRVILEALGIEDYGIYNVVGGVVAMFSMLTGSLSAAISRFLTFELGKNDQESLKKTFSAAVTIQVLQCVVVIAIAEPIGLYFLNNKMNIPEGRLFAANWVLQLSLITFCLNLTAIPYNASIIAHERMSAFAYMSIFEAISRLGIAILILISPIDRLIFYSILMTVVAFAVRTAYCIFCRKNFSECKFHFNIDTKTISQMFNFAGWNFIGASSAVLRDQGGNILLNLFFGPIENAARGVAIQVQNAVSHFSQSFTTALNPQITKNYANGNHEYMMRLIYVGARLSFYMLFVLTLPIIQNTNLILSAWLKVVPNNAVLFTQLALIFVLSESISTPLITAMLATGNIKKYQIIVGGLQMLNLPLSYALLKCGFRSEYIFIIAIVISQCCFFSRLFLLKNMIELNIKQYLKEVYLNVITVSTVATIPAIVLKNYLEQNSLIGFVCLCTIAIICSIFSILFLGCNAKERSLVFNKMSELKNKVLKK